MASSITPLRLFSLGMSSLACGTSSGPLPCCSGCWVPNLREAKAAASSLKDTICGVLGRSPTMERVGKKWKALPSSSRQELRLVDVHFLSSSLDHYFKAISCAYQDLFEPFKRRGQAQRNLDKACKLYTSLSNMLEDHLCTSRSCMTKACNFKKFTGFSSSSSGLPNTATVICELEDPFPNGLLSRLTHQRRLSKFVVTYAPLWAPRTLYKSSLPKTLKDIK